MRRLYDGIASGEFESDEVAAIALYGDAKKMTNYKKLKYRLEQRLINTIFFIDINKPSFNDSQKVFYNSYKQLAAANILNGRGSNRFAKRLAERILPKVLEYDMPDIAVGVLNILVHYYGSKKLDAKKFKHYSELLTQQLKAFEAETKSFQYDSWIKIHYFKRLSPIKEIHQQAGIYRKELREYLKYAKSPGFLRTAYNVFANEYLLVNDHFNAIKIHEEAITRFPEAIIDLYRQTNQYQKVEEAVEKVINLNKDFIGTNSGMGMFSLYVSVCFYQQDYQKAYDVYHEATFKQNMKKFRLDYQNQFKLYRAFLEFFINAGKIDITKSEYPALPKFRLSKFVNNVPEFAQDKRLNNITLIIIQVLFLIQQKKYDVVIDKVEALNMYCHRYLKKDDTFRSNCFIKMLLTLPRSNFNRIAVERNAKKLHDQLKSVPIEKANQSEHAEVVPYDFLWEIVLEMLDAPTKKVVK